MFEPLWNNKYIESVQLTIAEQLGVEERGEFYDITGALRDMVQNHLMQMLCMTAMEAPASLDADAVRDEKVKVIKSLKPLTIESVNENVVRGQYTAAKGMNGYLQEINVPQDSFTRNLRRHQSRNRKRPLERRSFLPAYRQTHGGQSGGNRIELPSAAKPYF